LGGKFIVQEIKTCGELEKLMALNQGKILNKLKEKHREYHYI
jgi:hypothetical protein